MLTFRKIGVLSSTLTQNEFLAYWWFAVWGFSIFVFEIIKLNGGNETIEKVSELSGSSYYSLLTEANFLSEARFAIELLNKITKVVVFNKKYQTDIITLLW